LKQNAEYETEIHYLSIETKNSTTRHKQHFEIKPWDGRQMVNTKSLILF
jgi:hypothetical protein